MEIKNIQLESSISKAKKGNQTAFKYLLDTFWLDVYKYQLKRTNSENDAEDIAIQTFSKAFDKIHTFDEKYVFKTWLITISKNIHIDLLRKKSSSIRIENAQEQEEKIYLVVDDNPTPEDKHHSRTKFSKIAKRYQTPKTQVPRSNSVALLSKN